YMVFDKLVVVKNLISQIIDLITQLTSSQGCFGNIFNALLSVFGISSAFNSLSSIFFSAITFILMVILYKILFKIHYFFSEKLTNILSMV
ncbi:MAG: hypothetical protein M0P43_08395, partial [Arcobacteraceae bacterium]|nr:hypothetical protein [Arcobacteraceae bacterium]